MKIEFSKQLFVSDDDAWVVDYIVVAKGVGKTDIAIKHMDVNGSLIRANRVYWSGKGKDRAGHWDLRVGKGESYQAVVIDLDHGSEQDAEEISDTISYTVE